MNLTCGRTFTVQVSYLVPALDDELMVELGVYSMKW